MSKVLRYYRFAHRLHSTGWKKSARVVSKCIRLMFSAEIPASCVLGEGVVLKHGALNVVIHDSAVIGDHTVIFHNVTIGGREGLGHPIIGRNVYIGCGAVILGDIVIGDNAKIGANAVVVKNVPEGKTVVGIPAKEIGND